VAIRAGKCRITYQPAGGRLNNREGLELRVNGKVIDLRQRQEFCEGNFINKTTAGGEVDIRLVDGTRVVITPTFWTSQGYWYLDVQVFNTPAREGVMGHILAGDFLPLAPDGSSFGPKPVALLDRHILLNHKFADAWRVTASTSLFDYAAGTTTATFTDTDWPSAPGGMCTSTTYGGPTPKVREPRPDLAKKVCRGIKDEAIYNNCIFDVTTMGDAVFAAAHKRADQLKALAH